MSFSCGRRDIEVRELRCCLLTGESPPSDSHKAVNIKRTTRCFKKKKKKKGCPNKLAHKHASVHAQAKHVCIYVVAHIHRHLSLQGDLWPSPTAETRSVGMQLGILQSPWLLTSALFGSAHKRRWSARASLSLSLSLPQHKKSPVPAALPHMNGHAHTQTQGTHIRADSHSGRLEAKHSLWQPWGKRSKWFLIYR